MSVQTLLLVPETVALLFKLLKAPELALRAEAATAVGRLAEGTGRAMADQLLRDVYKALRSLLADKAAPVQVAAAEVSLVQHNWAHTHSMARVGPD
jgi:uncharacterized protein (DUF2336 family)